MPKASGPDDPVGKRAEDILGRWNLARSIYDLIRNSPPDWSLRIGVYGRWGEGKTSVLRFVETLATVDRSAVIVWFNPWAIGATEEIWLSFAEALYSVLDPKRAKALAMRKRILGARRLLKIVTGWRSETRALGKLGDLALGHLEVTKAEIEEAVRDKLGARKLIILIDDLDRAKPEIAPHLLLGIREVVTVPGCFFVVALDPKVIADGLPAVNPGWSSTQEFLHKVIDYEFHLRAPTSEALKRLARDQVHALELGVPDQTLDDLADLLPMNPRHLKKLLRGLARLKPTLARHDADETPWTVLLLLELMRQASPFGADRLFRDSDLLGRMAAATVRLRDGMMDEVIRDLEARAGTAENVDALVRVVRSFMERQSWVPEETITYWIRATEEPPAVTLQETRTLLAGARDVETLRAWLAEQARRTDSPIRDVMRTLLACLLIERESALEVVSLIWWKSAEGVIIRCSCSQKRLRPLVGGLRRMTPCRTIAGLG
jgi:hypothetical protein